MKLNNTDSLAKVSERTGVELSHLIKMDALFSSIKTEGIFVKKNSSSAIQIGYKVAERHFYADYNEELKSLHSCCDRVVNHCAWVQSITVFLTGNKSEPYLLTMYTGEGEFQDKFRLAKDLISYLEAFLAE